MEQLSTAELSHESRCHQLERELSRSQSTTARLEKELGESLTAAERVHREHKEKVWKMEASFQAMEDRGKELEGEVDKCHVELQRKQEIFQRK